MIRICAVIGKIRLVCHVIMMMYTFKIDKIKTTWKTIMKMCRMFFILRRQHRDLVLSINWTVWIVIITTVTLAIVMQIWQ